MIQQHNRTSPLGSSFQSILSDVPTVEESTQPILIANDHREVSLPLLNIPNQPIDRVHFIGIIISKGTKDDLILDLFCTSLKHLLPKLYEEVESRVRESKVTWVPYKVLMHQSRLLSDEKSPRLDKEGCPQEFCYKATYPQTCSDYQRFILIAAQSILIGSIIVAKEYNKSSLIPTLLARWNPIKAKHGLPDINLQDFLIPPALTDEDIRDFMILKDKIMVFFIPFIKGIAYGTIKPGDELIRDIISQVVLVAGYSRMSIIRDLYHNFTTQGILDKISKIDEVLGNELRRYRAEVVKLQEESGPLFPYLRAGPDLVPDSLHMGKFPILRDFLTEYFEVVGKPSNFVFSKKAEPLLYVKVKSYKKVLDMIQGIEVKEDFTNDLYALLQQLQSKLK